VAYQRPSSPSWFRAPQLRCTHAARSANGQARVCFVHRSREINALQLAFARRRRHTDVDFQTPRTYGDGGETSDGDER
jgi:hypothetical protein